MPIYSFLGTGTFQLAFSHGLKNPKDLPFMHVGNTFSFRKARKIELVSNTCGLVYLLDFKHTRCLLKN